MTEPAAEGVASGAAGSLHALTADGSLTEGQLWALLAAAPATCFGEVHDNAAHHDAQVRAARELAARARAEGLPFALGFEMFQTPFQAVLSEFAMGSVDEEQLLAQSEYFARWGYDFALYRPLLELVRELGLPALALNAPVELTREIGDGGLEALSPDERASLPELNLWDAAHREYVSELLEAAHAGAALGNPYTVQVVWDETMAETSAQWLSRAGDSARLMVIAGLGHCHRSAVPSRITRRTGLPVLAVGPLFASELGAPGSPTLEHYDVLVVLRD